MFSVLKCYGSENTIKAEKMQRAMEANSLRELAESWQACLDEMASDMLIVRVARDSPSRYKIFYVSENRFADGNRYPEFLETLKLAHPQYYISLRHIRDVDGHFVTRDEYVCRKSKMRRLLCVQRAPRNIFLVSC